MKLNWAPLALAQAEEAADFIANQGRPGAAVAWLEGLFVRVRSLADFPEQGRVVPELAHKDIRELQYQGFRIIYRTSGETVGILSVRHVRRRPLVDPVVDP